LIPLSSRGIEDAVAISKIRIFFGDHHVASLLVMTGSIGNFGIQRLELEFAASPEKQILI